MVRLIFVTILGVVSQSVAGLSHNSFDLRPGFPMGGGYKIVQSESSSSGNTVRQENSEPEDGQIKTVMYFVSLRKVSKDQKSAGLRFYKKNCEDLNPKWFTKCDSGIFYNMPAKSHFEGYPISFKIKENLPYFRLEFYLYSLSLFQQYRYYMINPIVLESNPTWSIYEGDFEIKFQKIPVSN